MKSLIYLTFTFSFFRILPLTFETNPFAISQVISVPEDTISIITSNLIVMVLTSATNMLFSCGICREHLHTDMTTLPCLHNFCRCCVEHLFRKQLRQNPQITPGNHNSPFSCPDCSSKVFPPDTSDGIAENYAKGEERIQWVLDSLEPNTFILNLLKAKELQQNTQLCERCFKEHSPVSASAWCRECNKCFCSRCLKLHQDFTMHFEVVFLSDGDLPNLKDLMPRRKCDTHKEPVNTYCTQCRLCLCQSCWMDHYTVTSSCPPPLPLEKLAGLKKADANVMLSDLKTCENGIKRQYEGTLSRISKVKEEFKVASEQIRADRDRLIKIFTKKTDDLLISLESAAKAETEELVSQLSQNGTWLNQMEFLALNVNTLLTNATSIDLVSCYSKLDSCWDNLQAGINSEVVIRKKLSVNYSGQYAKLLQNAEQMTVGQMEINEETAHEKFLKVENATIVSPDAGIKGERTTATQCQLVNYKDAMSQTQTISKSNACIQSGESIPKLIDTGRWSVSGSSIDFVDGIAITDDDTIFLCCHSLRQVREYTSEGVFRYACSLPCRPFDIASLTDEVLAVVSSDDHMLVLLFRTNSYKEPLKLHKVVSTKQNYISVCGFGNRFYACQLSGNVDLINAEAHVMIVVAQPSTKPDPRHRITLGSTTHSVVFLDYADQTVTLYGRSGKVYSTSNARNHEGKQSTSHVYMDAHGTLFACSNIGIYTVATEDSPSCILWTFENKKIKCAPRMCISGNKLVFSYFTNNRKEIRVFKISYLS